MVTEFRQLVFSSSELKSAIKTFNTIKTFNNDEALQLPVGDVVECEIIDEPSISARLRIRNVYGSSEDQEVEVQASYLAAALIHYCAQNKIPIPRSTTKNLERAGDSLVLSFSINDDPQAVSSTDD